MESLNNLVKDWKGIDIPMNDLVPIVLTGIIVIFLIKVLLLKKRNLPPGPIGLPFVGYVPFLGKNPHETLSKLSKKYGSVMSLRLGSRLTIVLDNYDSVKDGLSHSSAMDRGIGSIENLKNIGFGVYNGEKWIEQRRFSMKTMRNLGLGRGPWEKLVREEVDMFLDVLQDTKGQPFNPHTTLSSAINHNILALLIGRRFGDSEVHKIELTTKYIKVAFAYNGPSNAAALIPGARKVLEFFDISGYGQAATIISDFRKMLSEEIETVMLKSDPGKEDFIQLYADKMNEESKGTNKHYFTVDNLHGNVNALFLGAGDTIYSTLSGLLLYMAEYQEIQKKVQKELDEVIGRDGCISYEERFNVPYTFATLLEFERIATIVPISTPREAPSDFEFYGYTIPKGAYIVGNLWALHHDPKYWKDPEVFSPERFLDKDGKLVTNRLSYVPFSIGRRNCPGETVAWMESLVFFTAILQKFHVKPVPGRKINFDIIYGLVIHFVPQELCFVERK